MSGITEMGDEVEAWESEQESLVFGLATATLGAALYGPHYESGLTQLHPFLPSTPVDEWTIKRSGRGVKYWRDGGVIRFRGKTKAVRMKPGEAPRGGFLPQVMGHHTSSTRSALALMTGQAIFANGRLRSSAVEQTLELEGEEFRFSRWTYEAK